MRAGDESGFVNPIACIIDGNKTEEKSNQGFFHRDFSHVWLDILKRRTGRTAVFSPGDSPELIFNRRSFAVVTSSCSDADSGFMEEAIRFVSRGGVLLMEMPGGRWCKPLGLPDKLFDSPAVLYQQPLGFGIPGENLNKTEEILESSPILTRAIHLDYLPEGWQTLLFLASRGVLIQKPIGKGSAIVLLFDFSMEICALRQGIPSEPDGILKEKRGRVPFVVEPDDLALHDKMLDNPFPYADILEGYLWNRLEKSAFLPSLWYYPFDYDGVFLMTHDDEKRGFGSGKEIIQKEIQEGWNSTFFAIASGDFEKRWKKAGDYIIEEKIDLQWHWNRFPDNFKIIPPSIQLQNLSKIPGTQPAASRIHFLNLGEKYNEALETLNRMGILYDSTYGPNRGRGYLFGTGLPFHPLSNRGSLMELMEFPFISQEDWGCANEEYIENIFKNSMDSFHSVITMLFHPHKGISRQGTVRSLWEKSFELARKYNHWITSISKIGIFTRRKENLEIRTGTTRCGNIVRILNPQPGLALKLPVHFTPARNDLKARKINDMGVEYNLYIIEDSTDIEVLPQKFCHGTEGF